MLLFFFFLSLICANAFYFHAVFVYFIFLNCIMHSAFNLFVFPNYMFTSLLLLLLRQFKVASPSNIGDMRIHSKMTV